MKSWLARTALGRLINWIRTPYYYRAYDPFETVHITHRLISQHEVPRWYPEYYEQKYGRSASSEAADARLADLVRSGVVRAPAGASTADGARLGQDPEGRVLAALLAERDEGR